MSSTYSLTVSSAGQVTIPKSLREFLGVVPGEKIRIVTSDTPASASVEREQTLREFLTEMDARLTDSQRAVLKDTASMTAAELYEQAMESEEEQSRREDRYGH